MPGPADPLLGAAIDATTPMAFDLSRISQAENDLRAATLGYGTEVRKPDAGPQKPEPMNFPLLRRTTTSPGQKFGDQILQLQGNPNDPRGGKGTCSGDSGGPVFLNGYLVAVSSYGFNTICRYIDGYQRTDITDVQDWLTLTTG